MQPFSINTSSFLQEALVAYVKKIYLIFRANGNQVSIET